MGYIWSHFVSSQRAKEYAVAMEEYLNSLSEEERQKVMDEKKPAKKQAAQPKVRVT